MNQPILREFSAIGPCLTRGPLVRETKAFFIYRDHRGNERRAGKRIGRYTPLHTEPCRGCTDHPNTSYPNGYTD